MTTVARDTLIGQLGWRYATKRFDPGRPVSPEDWEALTAAMVLSASSFGLQPWRFVVVETPEIRARLREAAFGQAQVTDAPRLVVFAARTGLSPADVDRHIARVAEVRGTTPESLDGYRRVINGKVGRPRDEVDAWASRQVYIAVGTFLTAAAMLGVDACPMEGFDPGRVDAILGLGESNCTAVVLVAAGHRSDDDPAARLAKVRFPTREVVLVV